ncbi:MAG: hypothetical protein EOP19_00075 [Hyphomicrobiales bacterium]|nr:MAG: hypothetical protein EOP19_00075 [Hyphomicrobiales bacterium]
MPTFNVRMDTGDGPDDGEPIDFPDAKQAAYDAQVAMAEVAREKIPGEKRAALGIEIDDVDGNVVYRATMDFQGRDAADPDPAPLTAEVLPQGPRD